jgi:ATP-binding cassette subfamily B protein
VTGVQTCALPISAFVEEADVVIESALTFLFAGTALLRASPRLAAIAGISVPLLLVPVRLLTPKSRAAFAEKATASAGLNQMLGNILSGIVEVKSFTAEEFEAERVRQLGAEVTETEVRANSYGQLQMAISGNIFYGGYALAMAHGAQRVLARRMPSDQLMRAGFWYPRLISSLGRVSETPNVYYGARTAADRLQSVLDTEPGITDGPIRRARSEIRGDIAFERVSFGYDPSVPVLRDLSLDIPAGSTVAIVGPTGSGKSTLLRLLLRFFDPTSGELRLDGHELSEFNIRDLRSAIALVNQEVYLFKGTVRHNVLYGRPTASDEDVIGALAAAGAADLLDSLPHGLDQEVGERGQRLSGGQRQRVAIARALLKGAPILALDEPTSQLDYATEAVVKASLKSATAGQTVIFVAHRLATIRDADKVIVLDQGFVREEGTHESLLNQGGLYSDLWRLQS